MKANTRTTIFTHASIVFLTVLWLIGSNKTFAEVEIDLDEASKPAPTSVLKQAPVPVVKLTPTPSNSSNQQAVETPTLVPVKADAPMLEPTVTPVPEKEDVEVEEGSAPKDEIIHGVLKMKNVYEAGINSYKEKDYDQAIRYFTKAVSMEDKYTPKFYYAEAYAMMGVIYQFRIIRYQTAYNYYKQALKYEPHNRTARKHIKEVAKHLK